MYHRIRCELLTVNMSHKDTDKPPLVDSNPDALVESGIMNIRYRDSEEIVKPKRGTKRTAKALCDKLDRLQKSRKSKLIKAGKFRNTIHDLMSSGNVLQMQQALMSLLSYVTKQGVCKIL